MKNNEMIEYKENFMTKLRKLFSNIWRKNEKYNSYSEDTYNEKYEQDRSLENAFFDSLKVDTQITNDVLEKNRFLKEIDGNRELLNMLSIDRLKKLEKYYDKVIEQNNEKIIRLKQN